MHCLLLSSTAITQPLPEVTQCQISYSSNTYFIGKWWKTKDFLCLYTEERCHPPFLRKEEGRQQSFTPLICNRNEPRFSP